MRVHVPPRPGLGPVRAPRVAHVRTEIFGRCCSRYTRMLAAGKVEEWQAFHVFRLTAAEVLSAVPALGPLSCCCAPAAPSLRRHQLRTERYRCLPAASISTVCRGVRISVVNAHVVAILSSSSYTSNRDSAAL